MNTIPSRRQLGSTMWTTEFDAVRHLVKQTKYLKRNPLRQHLIRKYLEAVSALVAQTPADRLLDVGSGEGFVVRHLGQQYQAMQSVGVDLDIEVLTVARALNAGSAFVQAEIARLPIGDDAYDLVICNEVLEHLYHPDSALRELERVTRQYCIVSVPREPHYRLANILIGANLRNWGDDPGHHQRWNYRQFVHFLRRRFEVVCVVQPTLWTMVLCRVNMGH